MFGITKNQNSSTDSKHKSKSIRAPLDSGNADFDIREKNRIGLKTETEKDVDRLGLDTNFAEDKIDDELREKLSDTDDVIEKVSIWFYKTEIDKDQLGMDRFYSGAIKPVGSIVLYNQIKMNNLLKIYFNYKKN